MEPWYMPGVVGYSALIFSPGCAEQIVKLGGGGKGGLEAGPRPLPHSPTLLPTP